MGLPFDGIRILDFSWWGVGPMILRHLAEYGAQVIKVETVTRIDPIRIQYYYDTSAKDGVGGLNRGGLWASLNHGRLGISLNLKHPEAVAVARRLVAISDVVNENFTTGKLDQLGLGYDELTKIRPDIILMSTNVYGQTGPAASHPGHGGAGQVMALLSHFTGWQEAGPPTNSGGTAGTDYLVPQLGACVLIAALDYRRRTGEPQHIDLAQLESALMYFGPAILDYTVNGNDGEKLGNRSSCAAPHGVFRCRGEDRWIAIAVLSDADWKTFRDVLGNPAWAEDPTLDSVEARLARQGEMEERIAEWTANWDARELMERLQAVGIAAGIASDGADLLADPQLRHRQHLVHLEHPVIGRQGFEQRPYRLSETPGAPPMPGPVLGQHNGYVFRELLGMSSQEIEHLTQVGAIA